MATKIYKFHTTTGELLGDRIFLGDNFQLGPNETLVAPPDFSGPQIPIYANGSWTLTPDWRRVIFYRKSNQQPVRLPLGASPDSNVTRVKPTDTAQVWSEENNRWILPLAAVKAKKLVELFRICDSKLAEVLAYYPQREPETWPEKIKQSEYWVTQSLESKQNIISSPATALPFAMLFAEATGTYLPTAEQIPVIDSLSQRILGNKTAFGAFAGIILKMKTDLARAINDAATVEEVGAISLDFSGVSLQAIFAQMNGNS